MWWLIAWAFMSLVSWAFLAFMMAAVPSSERASTGDLMKLGAIAFVAWAIVMLVIFGLVSIVQGIF